MHYLAFYLVARYLRPLILYRDPRLLPLSQLAFRLFTCLC